MSERWRGVAPRRGAQDARSAGNEEQETKEEEEKQSANARPPPPRLPPPAAGRSGRASAGDMALPLWARPEAMAPPAHLPVTQAEPCTEAMYRSTSALLRLILPPTGPG